MQKVRLHPFSPPHYLSLNCLIFTVESVATLFRGTTMATTLMDQYMKMTTSTFVHAALQPTIDKIMESKVSCEVTTFVFSFFLPFI